MSKTFYDEVTLADWLEQWCEIELPDRVIFIDNDGKYDGMWILVKWNEIWRYESKGKCETFRTKDVWAVWLDEHEDGLNYLGIERRTGVAR